MGDKVVREYKKISAGRQVARYIKLWMGKDHLLLCESPGYTEDYKRFYFRDIQAILLGPSARRLIWGIIGGSFLALTVILMLAFHDPRNWFLWFCGGLFFSLLLINYFKGPSCRCHLKTAVQTIELPITRRRKAEKIVRQLKPLIDAAQASLPGGPVPVPPPFSPEARTFSADGKTVPGVGMRPFRAGAHWVLFGFLFLNALTALGRFFSLDLNLYLIESFSGLGSVIPLVFALVWQSKSDASKAIQKITMGVIVYVIIEYFLSLIWGTILSFQHPQLARDQWALIKLAAGIGPDHSVFATILTVFEIAGSSIFSVIGIIELIRHQRRASADPSSR